MNYPSSTPSFPERSDTKVHQFAHSPEELQEIEQIMREEIVTTSFIRDVDMVAIQSLYMHKGPNEL